MPAYEPPSRIPALRGCTDEKVRAVVIDKVHCPGQGAKRLEEAIDHYVAIAKTVDEDFDRALRAAWIALELIGGGE